MAKKYAVVQDASLNQLTEDGRALRLEGVPEQPDGRGNGLPARDDKPQLR